MSQSPFLIKVRKEIRLRGYSIRTEKTYMYWIKQYIYFHHYKHPEIMGAEEVKSYLSHMAENRSMAINTQKVALNRLVFLYHKIINCTSRRNKTIYFRMAVISGQFKNCLDIMM
ncbi:site-specific integrase [Neptunomonas japonica]|uniref:site-specific integrase n=1 Tax=Neptunomonas japonica TaxID=417574 RepID=UPI002E34C8EF|nr:site-specific integrase [Neptunomonas japonica]